MIRRNTWVLLGVFGISLVAAWCFQQGKPASASPVNATTTSEPVKTLLQGISTQDLTGIEIHTSKAGPVALIRSAKGGWTLKDHPEVQVDPGKVEELLSELTTVRVITTLASQTHLEDFGLVLPATVITLNGTRDGRKVLQIGAETPTSSGYYARVDAEPPVIVSQESIDRILDLFSAGALAITTSIPGSSGSLPATAAP